MGIWTLTLILKTLLGHTINANAIRAYEVAITVYGISKGNQLWVAKQKENGDA